MASVATFVPGFHDVAAVARMLYRPFGASGRLVSAFSLGASSLSGVFGTVDEVEGIEFVRTAVRSGVNLIDTAPWYGNGKSERELGKALTGVPRQAYYLHTKVGRYVPDVASQFDFTYDRTLRSIDESLERLGLDYIDTVQVHDPEFSPDLNIVLKHTLPAIKEAIRRGKVKSAGITGYPLETLRYLASHSPIPLLSAISYSHLTVHDQSLVTSGTAAWLRERGLGVINAAPLSMGLLTTRGPPTWHPAAPALKQRAAEAAAYCTAHGLDFSRLCLAFSFAYNEVDTHMPSVVSVEQLRANLDLMTGVKPLTQVEQQGLRHMCSSFFHPDNLRGIASWEGTEVTKYWVKLGKAWATSKYVTPPPPPP